MQQNKELNQIKNSFYIVIATMLILVTAFAFFYKRNNQELAMKDYKISMLVDEIGQVKNQNEQVYQYLNVENQKLAESLQITDDLHGSSDQKVARPKDSSNQTSGGLTNFVKDEAARLKEIITPEDTSIIIKQENLLNVLILGSHKGLTDTIILAGFNDTTNKISLINIPRDLFYNGRKINELFQKYGAEETEKAVSKITGLIPDKFILVDMDSFVKVIDLMGGIDVNVKKSFEDNMYPGANFSYKLVSFTKGPNHFDGATALEFVRSRETTSDFDRSQRQQLVLASVKAKANELKLTENLGTAVKIFNSVTDKVKTDINPVEVVSYLKKYSAYEIKTGSIISTQNYLYSTHNSAGQYILLPFKNSFEALKNYIESQVQS